MDSLHKRIEKRIPGSKTSNAKLQKDSDKELSPDEKETPKINLSFDSSNYKSLHKQHNLSALPSSDINLATVNDLSPIYAAEKEVYRRLSKNPQNMKNAGSLRK